jgi:hypothetical protein
MLSIEQLRKKSKVGPLAMFDFVVTFIVIFVLWVVFLLTDTRFGSGLWLIRILLLVLPLSVLAHTIFQKETPLTKMTWSTDFTDTGSIISKMVMILSLFVFALSF